MFKMPRFATRKSMNLEQHNDLGYRTHTLTTTGCMRSCKATLIAVTMLSDVEHAINPVWFAFSSDWLEEHK
jgi:hypothetical protein